MPTRLNIFKVPTPTVQGDDSWIMVKRRTLGEIETAVDPSVNVLEHVLEWNWVGDDGQPLPKPAEARGLITDLEMLCLTEAVCGNPDRKK